jgi:hypothetical protein
MHGLVSLRLAYPNFDWPPLDQQIAALVDLILVGVTGARGAARHEAAPAAAPAG